MEHFDIIILGAGASGCVASIIAGKKGKNVLLIDKLAKAGKKLLATGNGRCNLTNNNLYPSKNFYNQNIDKYLKRFDNKQALNLFNDMGLIALPDEEGRVYPFSNSAKSVVEILNNQLIKNNVSLSLSNEVVAVYKKEELFVVETIEGNFSCNKLVVCTGGKSVEKISHLGIYFKPFVPSLVALKTQSTRSLDGIKVANVKIEATCKGKTQSEVGEILFKDSGISGIVTFNISTLFARQDNFNGELKIDLMPQLTFEGLKHFLRVRKKLDVKISHYFDGLFVQQLGYYILSGAKIDEQKSCALLTEQEIEKLAFAIKNLTLNVKGHYDNNQVYSGGVKLDDLTDNLESKKIKNLYFCGEVCDVDGICGGYNLQWAWTSGYIVGESLW